MYGVRNKNTPFLLKLNNIQSTPNLSSSISLLIKSWASPSFFYVTYDDHPLKTQLLIFFYHDAKY
jgi:hypothetical protein